MPKPKHCGRNLGKWLAAGASAICLTAALIAATAAPSFAAGTYSTTASVNVRSGPGTGYSVTGSEPSGAPFTLLCQWQGGTNVNGNATWDDVTFTNGLTGAITDYYTTTPSWNSYAPGTGPCDSTPPPGSGSLGGVDMQRACDTQYPGRGLDAVATNANSAYSWQCVGPGASLGIDVTAECRAQYGYGAVSADSNPGSAWSWYCHWNITGQMQAAATWATAQASSGSVYSSHYGHDWSGWCEQFVEQGEGFQFTFGSAHLDYQAEANAGRIHTDTNPPPGALVFYGGANGNGHVAVSIGNGQEIGTYGYVGQADPIQQYPVIGFLSNPYLGWAEPFGS
jgi:uncharacterized protein YraI